MQIVLAAVRIIGQRAVDVSERLRIVANVQAGENGIAGDASRKATALEAHPFAGVGFDRVVKLFQGEGFGVHVGLRRYLGRLEPFLDRRLVVQRKRLGKVVGLALQLRAGGGASAVLLPLVAPEAFVAAAHEEGAPLFLCSGNQCHVNMDRGSIYASIFLP